jgi:hypothetical protein
VPAPDLQSSGPAPLRIAPLRGVRVTAHPAAIDGVAWPLATTVIRIAPDDAFVIDGSVDDANAALAHDPHAIVEDESLFVGAVLDARQLAALVERLEWPVPASRPALAQGMAAGLSIKLWLDHDLTLLILSASVLHEVAERLGPVSLHQVSPHPVSPHEVTR